MNQLESLKKENKILMEIVSVFERAAILYARENPHHIYEGRLQDPLGIHNALAILDDLRKHKKNPTELNGDTPDSKQFCNLTN